MHPSSLSPSPQGRIQSWGVPAGLRRHYDPPQRWSRLRRAARPLNSALRPGSSRGSSALGPWPLSLHCQEGNRSQTLEGGGVFVPRRRTPIGPAPESCRDGAHRFGLCSSGPSGCIGTMAPLIGQPPRSPFRQLFSPIHLTLLHKARGETIGGPARSGPRRPTEGPHLLHPDNHAPLPPPEIPRLPHRAAKYHSNPPGSSSLRPRGSRFARRNSMRALHLVQ